MFGFLANPNDEQRYAMLMAAAQMMQPGPGGLGGAAGRGLMAAGQGYQGAMALKDRRAEEAQQREMRQAHLDQMKQTQANQLGLRNAFQTAYAQPNLNLVSNDDEGTGQMPQVAGGGGRDEFLRLAGPYMDPMQAVGMMQKDTTPLILAEGARAVGRDGRVIAENPKDIKPSGPKAGDLQEVKKDGKIITYRHDGKEWVVLASSPQFKPDERRPRTQYDPDRGGIVDLDTAAFTPATQGGRPIAAKMPESQKKELADIEAQLAVVKGGLEAARKTPSAFGTARGLATLSGTLAESTAGKFDSPEERQSRAYVYNTVSKVINERAGAAQSAQELARLRSFLPAETDDSEQIQDKFIGFQKYLEDLRGARSRVPGAPMRGNQGGWSMGADNNSGWSATERK